MCAPEAAGATLAAQVVAICQWPPVRGYADAGQSVLSSGYLQWSALLGLIVGTKRVQEPPAITKLRTNENCSLR